MTRRAFCLCFALGVLALSPAKGTAQRQTPAPDQSVVVSGRVTLGGPSDIPVPAVGARVRVVGSSPEHGGATLTDANGHYTIRLTAGSYTVSAEFGGFVTNGYRATRPGRAGMSLRLAANEVRSDIDIALPPAGAISGAVTTPSGRPLSGVTVAAAQSRFVRGIKSLVRVGGEATTDGDGRFRLYGLPAGEYVVAASAVPRGAATTTLRSMSDEENAFVRTFLQRSPSSAASAIPQSDDSPVALVPVFHPSTLEADAAGRVSVASGQQADGVDIVVQPVRTSTVRGRVLLPQGPIPKGLEVTAIAQGPRLLSAGRPYWRSPLGASGEFEIAGLAPGNYDFIVKPTSSDTGSWWAVTRITLAGETYRTVDLVAEPGGAVAGAIEGKLEEGHVTISLTPVDGAPLLTSLAPVGRSNVSGGSFRLEGIQPGKYYWSVRFANGSDNSAAGHMIAGLFLGAEDVLDRPVDVSVGQTIDGLSLRLSTALSSLSGRVVGGNSAGAGVYSLVVFPVDPALRSWASTRIRTLLTDDQGYFSQTLRPGDYYLAAVLDLETGEEFDPGLLRELQESAIRVRIEPGQTTRVDFRMNR